MCRLSTDITTFEWREAAAYDRPRPIFSIEKQCRDYNGIFDWVKSMNLTSTHEQVTVCPRPADGVVETPARPQWLDLFQKKRTTDVPAWEYIDQHRAQ